MLARVRPLSWCVLSCCLAIVVLEQQNAERRRRLDALRRSADMYRSRLGLAFEQRSGVCLFPTRSHAVAGWPAPAERVWRGKTVPSRTPTMARWRTATMQQLSAAVSRGEWAHSMRTVLFAALTCATSSSTAALGL